MDNKPLNLSGWDTAYAITFDDVNQGIVAKKSSRKTIDFILEKPDDEDDLTGLDEEDIALLRCTHNLNGTFGDWQIVPGGDGKLVRLKIPLTQLTYTANNYGNDNDINLSVDSEISLTVQIELNWLTKKDGKFDLKIGSTDELVVISFDYTSKQIRKKSEAESLKECLKSYLIKNMEDFDHVFASIDYNQVFNCNENYRWLFPTHHEYTTCCFTKENASTTDDGKKTGKYTGGLLAILCMTEGRKRPDNHNIPENIISSMANGGFAFNDRFVLSNLLMPGLTTIFPKCDVKKDFAFDGQTELVNNKELEFKSMLRDEKGVFYDTKETVTPKIAAQGFSMRLQSGKLVLDMKRISYDYNKDFKVYLSCAVKYALNLDKERKFKITEADVPDTHTLIEAIEHEKSTWEQIKSTGIDIAVSVGVMMACMGLTAATQRLLRPKALVKGAAKMGEAEAKIASAEIEAATSKEIARISESAESSKMLNVSGSSIALEAQELATAKQGKISSFFSGSFGGMLIFMMYQIAIEKGMTFYEFAKSKNMKNSVDIPGLDMIASQALSPISWPNAQKDGFTIVDGSLKEGSFHIALAIKFNPL